MLVQYPSFRSSTIKRDPCIQRGKWDKSLLCDNKNLNESQCKVFTTADGFLGEDFHKKVMGDSYAFPHVLIIDSLGCNLKCWFCYAWQYRDYQTATTKGCKPTLVHYKNLAEYVKCKIEKLKEFRTVKISNNYKMYDLPLSRIRISGGEPIYASKETLSPYSSKIDVDYTLGMEYWILFLKELNKIMESLASQNGINIISNSDWKDNKSDDRWKKDNWPTFIDEKGDKVNVRFDTNGLAFGNNDIAKNFVKKIHDLHSSSNLNVLRIWITYSLKGPTPTEFYWSQGQRIEMKPENDYELLNHPQYKGIYNLMKEINDKKGLKNHLKITVEKGINHDFEHKVYLYSTHALKWNLFEEKTGIKLSSVKNDINLIYQHRGEWGIKNKTPSLMTRYLGRGATINIFTPSMNIVLSKMSSKGEIEKAIRLLYNNYPNVKVIVGAMR